MFYSENEDNICSPYLLSFSTPMLLLYVPGHRIFILFYYEYNKW